EPHLGGGLSEGRCRPRNSLGALLPLRPPRPAGLLLDRRLAALEISRDNYHNLFGIDPMEDFHREWLALEQEGLIEFTPTAIRPTPRGIFYADSIAALLAWRQSRHLRSLLPVHDADEATERVNSNGHGHM